MFCRPITLCLFNCITETLQVTNGHVLASPAINIELCISLFIRLAICESLNVLVFYKYNMENAYNLQYSH
jgi:hypothetical protein